MTNTMTTTDTARTFNVDASMLDVAKERFAKLAAKAAKLGVPVPVMSVGLMVEVKSVDEYTGRTKVKAYFPVTVTVAPVKLAGWTLVAALDHVEGGVIARTVPGGVALPAPYLTAKSVCTHCHTDRARNTTFVLQHETGAWAQVGTSCLTDFLGLNPATFVQAGTFLSALGGFMDDDFMGGGRRDSREDTVWYLSLVARLIQAEGWVSRKVAKEFEGRKQATADSANSVIYLLGVSNDSRERREAQAMVASITDEHRTVAREAVEWVRSQHGATTSDYMHNLTVLTVGDSFDVKYSGLVASIVPTFQRHLGREVERKQFAQGAATSVFVGEKGKRMPVDLTVLDLKTFDGDYGVRTLVMMVDPAGNRYKWWTGEVDLAVGDAFVGKGTVKDHEVYKDVKWTVLTRVAVTTKKEKVS